MKNLELMKNNWILAAVVTVAFLGSTIGPINARPVLFSQAASNTYTWHGELVALDQNSRTITVKARLSGENILAELGSFKSGDRVILGWSAFDTRANSINRVMRADAASKSADPYMFPAEYVSLDAANQYLTFKTQVPAESVSTLRSLKAGEWITATSPQGDASRTQAIVAVKPYNG